MKYALITNGAITGFVSPDVAFTHNGKQYSARFLRSATKAEKVEVGVYEVIEGARADERFYWVSQPSFRVVEVDGTVEATYTATAKLLEDREESDEQGNPLYVQEYDPTANNGEGAMVNTTERLVTKGLKSQWTAQVKQTAGSLLSGTDWMVIRKAERDVAIPAETQTYRAAVISEADRLETAIAGAADVDALAAVVAAQNWPKA
jgi:hypothetical protein